MASKLRLVSELAEQTARGVTQDVDSWKGYLSTASRLYKYSFDDQLLLYAQRPDATACASMELWNDAMRRWVKPRSEGIALIHKDGGGRPRLDYVFDVADTRPVRGARTPYLWELREEHHAAVAQALDRQYGPTEEGDFGWALMEQAKRAVGENYRDHLEDLRYDAADSLLEELDDLNLEVRFRNILTASVQYTLLTRCGLDPGEYLEDEDLLGITEFSTPAVLHHLGDAASKVSMDFLNEIGRAVRAFDRDRAKNREENMETPLAKSSVICYTKAKDEFNDVKHKSTERSIDHDEETDLQTGGGLPDPGPGAGWSGRAGGVSPGQVRPAAGDLPEGAPPRDLHLHAADRAAGAPSAGDRPAGEGTGGPDDGRSEETERGRRGDEGPRPDGLGSGGEQLYRPGGGDRVGGDRLQVNPKREQTAGGEPAASASAEETAEPSAPAVPDLSLFSLFPTVEEQIENIVQAQAEDQRTAQQHTPTLSGQVQSAVIGRALTSGGNEPHSIERIVAFFQKGHTGSAAASFMEKEFGEGGKGVTIAGQDYSLWFNSDGFRIAPGRSAFGPGSTLTTWVNAAAMVSNLLRDGAFATQEKIDAAPDNEVRELAEKLWYLRQDFSGSAKEQNLLPTISQHFFGKGFPDDTKEIAELLKAPVHRQQIMRELAVFADKHEKSPDLLRFRHHPAPRELLEQVAGLFAHREQFQSVEDFAPSKATFITEDEITRLLMRGGDISEAKLRIYAYFMQGHNPKECAKFLKESYGEGGYGRQGYNETYGAKGISLTREDEESGYKGYDTVTLDWNQAQKRVRDLIDSGRYLNDQEKAYLPAYEKVTLARRIYAFNYYKPDPDRTYPHEWDFNAAKRDILPLLDSPEQVEKIFNRMLSDFAPLSPDTPHYIDMQYALRDVGMYQRGESPLFTPLPEAVLEAERQKKQAEKEAKRNTPRTQRADSEAPPASGDRLAAAARALAKKRPAAAKEDQSGQFSLFSTAEPVSLEPELPAPEAEPRTSGNQDTPVFPAPPQAVDLVQASDADYTMQAIHAPMQETLTQQPETQGKRSGRTEVELNYRTFAKMFPEIASGEYRYLRMEAGEASGGMMPLHLEWIDTDVVAVSHTYTQNGDLMRDPEMTFRVDREKGTLEPLTFRQDGSIQIYQEVYPEPGRWIPKLRRDLNTFAQQWLNNISHQNYHKREAVIERDGEDVRLTFDQDGKTVEPAAAPAAENALGENPTVREIYEHYAPMVKKLVLADALYQNACLHSDRENAYLEGGEAVKRAAIAISWEKTDFMRQYYDNTAFHNRLHQEIISETYPMLSHSQPEQAAQPEAAEWAVSPVTLYRNLLEMTDREINRGGWLYEQLRDRSNDYNTAKEALETELDAYVNHVASGSPDIMAAYHTLPKFREWLIEDLMERSYQDVSLDQRDAPDRYSNDAEAPEWAKGAPPTPKPRYETWYAKSPIKRPEPVPQAQEPAPPAPAVDHSEPGQPEAGAEIPPAPETVPEHTGAGMLDQVERADAALAEPNLTPNVDEYLNLKAQHPDKLVGVQVGEYTLFYGKDAEAAAPAMGAKLLVRDVPGLGSTFVTGTSLGWPSALVDLLEHGHSVVMARPDPERGPDAPYEIVKERSAADYIPLGMELTIDGRRMKIDSVDFQAGTVSLRDLDMKGWFPIFRSEPIPFVREFVEEVQRSEEYIAAEMASALKEAEKTAADNFENGLPEEVERVELDGGQVTPPLPTAPRQPLNRRNFHITDDNLGVGGEKTKYQYNVTAIRTLKQIEAEGRLAAPEEQEILSRYVGWGGIAQAFDPNDSKWAKEYTELKELLTLEEYDSARSSVINSHYTSPTVIKAMYQAVENMNFQPGNVLEPSMGIGNFFGLLPEKLATAKLYGVELDDLTGRIARQLYQKADITLAGFEKTDRKDFYDLAVGNVPFGQYRVNDPAYNKLGFNIHNYFFAKTLDQVRPGGIVAFVTSRYTLDAKDPTVRKYLAERADLLGAIRLPNNAFKANAGTEVVSDIIFLQKRDHPAVEQPGWVQVGENEDGFKINSYFLEHPEMVLGQPTSESTQYGRQDYTVAPIEGANLSQQLAGAIQNLSPPDRELLNAAPEREDGKEVESIPADPSVRNFSYTLSDGTLYFRENSRMDRVDMGKTPEERIKGMIAIRDCVRTLIDLQMANASGEAVQAEQAKLNRLYDSFTSKYGLLSSRGNQLAFEQDSSYPLLCSLEVVDEEGRLERKADMFTKRTIQNRQPVTSVDTPVEALAVSIGERARVDLEYMAGLMGGPEKIPQIVEDLRGIIFKDPTTGPFDLAGDGESALRGWQAADEYLSGDVRRKLYWARLAAEKYPEFAVNVEKLEQVQPKDLTASEISVRIGASWVSPEYYQQFMFELLHTPLQLQERSIKLMYAETTGEWRVQGKNEDSRDNVRVYATYGTKRVNAYEIFEAALNQRDVRVFDKTVVDGKEVRVLNEKQTTIAQQKQEALCEAFKDWIFKDPQRRETLCKKYNEMFNNIRPREYDGSHINFSGMNPEISLRPHQQNAVAHILYGKNTLLAHCVGAGKTFEMVAAAMESKRLGLCQKSLFVVPNHLTEQWGGDFLRLYPGAKVLVATRKDFEPARRRKFCARIATGDYDAVIIGHSQFEKIPLSPERQRAVIREQISGVIAAIADAKANDGEKYTIKQMEKAKKSLEAKLEKLAAKEKKDNVVTFEELGVDRLFVDEAHSFKNLFLATKMRNVAGISQTDAQKSSDMFAKCRYMDELTGGRGTTFATGTPVSNSMVELYTMMRYLQYDTLEENGHRHFDAWAADFGEKVTAMELKPEGTGFRAKTRFAKFYNLPELISIWKEAADIQTADMLKLPVPEAEHITVTTEPSAFQKEMVAELGERAEAVRNQEVDPSTDNLLRITSDGRKLALDQRLQNPLLPDDPESKVNACVKNVFREWQDSAEILGTQLLFCDLSTPKSDGTFSVYDDIKAKLTALGIPSEEIAFIHDANTEAQKAELFAKVRRGQVRVLLGSTQKMGAGTNVQDRIVASHDLDCPWRPADLEQRAGRSLRQGNRNQKVKMYKYVTKGTFDAYNWGLVENKQKFIGQIMTSKSPARSAEDVDATALSYAEVKALATGDGRIREKMDLDVQVAKLKMLKAEHTSQQYEMQDKALKYYPQKIAETKLFIEALEKDLPIVRAHPVKDDAFTMTVMGTTYTERKAAGEALIAACKTMTDPEQVLDAGKYRGFPMQIKLDQSWGSDQFVVTMKQHLTYTSAALSNDPVGCVARVNNALEGIPEKIDAHQTYLVTLEKELVNAREEAERPFPKEDELRQKSARLAQLDRELEKPRKKTVERDGGPDADDGGAPAREPSSPSVPQSDKPSIRQALRDHIPPAPVHPCTDRSQRREAAL